jgi:hypothetical protein
MIDLLCCRDADGIGHNIDFHAVTGPGGGAAATYAEAGETKVMHEQPTVLRCSSMDALLSAFLAKGPTRMYSLARYSSATSAVLHCPLALFTLQVALFKMLDPGLFIYHCAAAPLPTHVANGMYGMTLVEPEGGLPSVDKEFCVVQSEVYAQKER